MIGVITRLLAICAVTLPCVSVGADYTSLYDSTTLQAAAETYNKNLTGTWNEDLVSRLPPSDREKAGQIRLRFPPVGTDRSPLSFSADASLRRVYVPTLSVKFLDDLAIAFAWLDHHGCDSSAAFDYVGMIRYQKFGGPIPPPLVALPVPKEALADQYVNDVSGKILKSAIYFIMAHELAHILYMHSGDVPFAVSQAQEIEADAYALEVMRRLSVSSREPVPPMGMVVFFSAVSRFELAPGDFESTASFESFARHGVTHPLSADRLVTMARAIRKNANDFSGGQNAWLERIRRIADDIEAIGKTLDDRQIRDFQRLRSLRTGMGALRTACK
ncbi:MAG: hypothetical protein A4E19_02310 [Nitrospira sp. SG-bin1]|nr:MAG: hypothetical protein A4E19_02310 [Nitrospira sp. SG-bin1]